MCVFMRVLVLLFIIYCVLAFSSKTCAKMFVFVSIMMHPIAVYRSLSFILPLSLYLSMSALIYVYVCVRVLLSSPYFNSICCCHPFQITPCMLSHLQNCALLFLF